MPLAPPVTRAVRPVRERSFMVSFDWVRRPADAMIGGMAVNPYEAPYSPPSREEPKGYLVLSFVTISGALAALTAINVALSGLVVIFGAHVSSPGTKFICNTIGTVLLSTATWAGWDRRWRLAIVTFIAGLLIPAAIRHFYL